MQAVNDLPPRRLLVALDFLEYLKGKDDDASQDVLNDAALMRDLRVAKRDWARRKTSVFTPWSNVRRHV